MKAIRFHRLGGPEVLQLDEVEKPTPERGEALVKIHAAGVNFADTLFRRGMYLVQPQFPQIPGAEASGVVEAVGEGAPAGLVGKPVAFLGQQAYAEYAAVNAKQLIPLPERMSLEDGAAFPLQALTAYHLLFTMDQARSGRIVLIHAAAGGVGLLAVQMAKLAGATVFATTSTEEKAALVRGMGADEVILYNRTDFAAEVARLTGGQGVDLVLDSVGQATFAGSLKSLAPFGHHVSYGAASGRPDPLDVLTFYENSIKVSAFWLMTAQRLPDLARASTTKVIEWIMAGKLKLVVGLRLPLAEAAEAHRRLEGRETTGKILLAVTAGG